MKHKPFICVSAGHNPKGKIACGASDYLDESTEARWLTKEVIKLLKKAGIKTKNCTCNNGKNQKDVLEKICKASNSTPADLTVSIHFNSHAHEAKSNGETVGTEVLVLSDEGIKHNVSKAVCNRISKLGFANRGIKVRDDLYFLRHTSAPAILIEVCFVSDADDARLYKKKKKEIAKAIASSIISNV